MRQTLAIGLCLALATVGLAVAGEGKKCSEDTQKCLNYLAQHVKDRGWAGVNLERGDDGKLVVTEVWDGTPAAAAGVKTGDVLLAINGIRYTEENYPEIQKLEPQMKPGATFNYTITSAGKERELTVTLAAMPADVAAAMVGRHMMEHAEYDIAQN